MYIESAGERLESAAGLHHDGGLDGRGRLRGPSAHK